ncbi:hypothetical protein FGU46_02885 [Methanobacterium sp. CWC-01]|uniref:zinc ribbon domain-containing protein n=1 Tax=Methanobacterium aridiramus TaxID=2584467 RepID=UPI002575D5FB|nr:zinc ribbon domain-containing protein [Methanobacterium sp. CWC-01]WJI09108.1 hypothetical protein FGU46_02885 [Methanobacterium sp. CWC-01]
MKCRNCGGEIRPEDIYCNQCGMELSGREYKPRGKKRRLFQENGDYKPLQNKFMKGEYQEQQADPYYSDEDYYHEPEEAYDYVEYPDYGDYRESTEIEEGETSIWGTLILFLVLALVVGFVVGLLIFTSDAQNILSLGT